MALILRQELRTLIKPKVLLAGLSTHHSPIPSIRRPRLPQWRAKIAGTLMDSWDRSREALFETVEHPDIVKFFQDHGVHQESGIYGVLILRQGMTSMEASWGPKLHIQTRIKMPKGAGKCSDCRQ